MAGGAIPSSNYRSRRVERRVVAARAKRVAGVAAVLGAISIIGVSATTLVLGRDRDEARAIAERARLIEAEADRIVTLARRAAEGDADERAAFPRLARRALLGTAEILTVPADGDELSGLRAHPRIIAERIDDLDATGGDEALRRVAGAAGDFSLAAGIAAELAGLREAALRRWITMGAWAPPALVAASLGAATLIKRTVSRRSVLLVDDDPVSRAVLAALLERRGLTVVTAESGGEALSEIDRDRFDLVVVDFRLPDIDGVELIRRLRERRDARAPTILLVSACISAIDARAALDAGADAALEKPLLWERVAPWLGRNVRDENPRREAVSTPAVDFDESRVREMIEILPPVKVRELAVRAAGSLREYRVEMNEAGDKGDLPRLSEAAHRVAGLAGIYGCVALRGAARALEDTIARGDGDPTAARLMVEERFAAAIERVDAIFVRR